MTYIADAQICLDEARTKIVPCDSPEARYNLALPGIELSDEVAQKYGLTGKKAVGYAPDEAQSPDVEEEKAVAEVPANKAVISSANKGK